MTKESKKFWIIPEERSGDIIDTLFANRDITDKEAFLKPSLKDIPSYKKMHGAVKAAKQIIKAVKAKRKIVIFGDYDADGVCATAILWSFIYRNVAKELDIEIDIKPFIPDRTKEGYGLSKKALEKVLKMGAELIITVDCGIRDKELIQKYSKEHKVDFIVTDHHQPPEDIEFDLDYTIVHQMYPGKAFPEQNISGAAVAFFLVQALKEQIGIKVVMNKHTEGLDLVGLSTVTDIMPLIGVNRAFVKFGLEQMKQGKNLGLKTLFKHAQVDLEKLESYHLGYVLGPRINAAGRIGDAIDALRLVLTEDPKAVLSHVMKLEKLNQERQSISSTAIENVSRNIDSSNKLIFVVGDDWHEGIIGLVAGKLLEQFGKPVVVVTKSGDEIKGSARSISSFNITEAITRFADLLGKYGGHVQAAGFSVKKGKLEEFKEKLVKYANETITDEDLVQELKIDLEIGLDEIDIETVEALDALKPYGYKNEKPLILISNAEVSDIKTMGAAHNHLKITLQQGSFHQEVILFSAPEDKEKISIGDSIKVVGNVGLNEWNGNVTPQFIVKEWKKENKS